MRVGQLGTEQTVTLVRAAVPASVRPLPGDVPVLRCPSPTSAGRAPGSSKSDDTV
jgi:hypothetical protein